MKSIGYEGAGIAPKHQDSVMKSMGYLGATTAPLKGGPMVCTSGPLWGGLLGTRGKKTREVGSTKAAVDSGGRRTRSTAAFGAVTLDPHHMDGEVIA
jgi:hypothetical protein